MGKKALIEVDMGKIFLFLSSFFILVSCGGNVDSNVDSIALESCFLNYQDPAELTEKLTQVSTKSHIYFTAVQGCLNYQLGHYSLAEELLKKAFQDSPEGDGTKDLSASILSLIYLKEFQKQNIKAYIRYASRHRTGRWVIALYHIDNYRETGLPQHLQKAISQIQVKHHVEGQTSATDRLLQHMLLIKNMEDQCGRVAKGGGPAPTARAEAPATNQDAEAKPTEGSTAGVSTQAQSSTCQRADLEEEKLYLFSTTYGFLDMLVKKPPFNHFRPQKSSETEDEDDTP